MYQIHSENAAAKKFAKILIECKILNTFGKISARIIFLQVVEKIRPVVNKLYECRGEI